MQTTIEPTAREALLAWIDRRCGSHREAARLLRLHFTHLSQILSGRRNPGLANAVRIQDVTGIPVTAWVPTDVDKPNMSDTDKARKAKKGKA